MFAVLGGIEAVVRGITLSVYPLLLYRAWGDAALVSKWYFLVGIVSLLAGLSVPMVSRHLPRRCAHQHHEARPLQVVIVEHAHDVLRGDPDGHHQVPHGVAPIVQHEGPVGEPHDVFTSRLFDPLSQQVRIGERPALIQRDAQRFRPIGDRARRQGHDDARGDEEVGEALWRDRHAWNLRARAGATQGWGARKRGESRPS